MKIPVLVLYANPQDQDYLHLREEEEAIREAVKTPNVNEVVPAFIRNAMTKDIHAKILQHAPEILYFAGHGDKNVLVFETYDFKTRTVKARPLANALSTQGNKLKCVILNSCFTDSTAAKIASEIKYVIGMRGSVDDDTAGKFAARFFEELNHGKSIVYAYLGACSSIEIDDINDYNKPIIFIKGTRFSYRELMNRKSLLEVWAIRLYQVVALLLTIIFLILMCISLYSDLVAINCLIPLLGFELHMRHYYEARKVKREFKDVNFT